MVDASELNGGHHRLAPLDINVGSIGFEPMTTAM